MENRRDYNTKQRKFIIEYLESKSNTTVSIPDIIEHLKKSGVSVSFTTVYRYLNRLSEEKKVIKFSADGQKAVYQIVGHENSCDGHIHIQCIKCGKLLHLDCDFMNGFKEHLMERHNFTLKCEGSILYGICDECSK